MRPTQGASPSGLGRTVLLPAQAEPAIDGARASFLCLTNGNVSVRFWGGPGVDLIPEVSVNGGGYRPITPEEARQLTPTVKASRAFAAGIPDVAGFLSGGPLRSGSRFSQAHEAAALYLSMHPGSEGASHDQLRTAAFRMRMGKDGSAADALAHPGSLGPPASQEIQSAIASAREQIDGESTSSKSADPEGHAIALRLFDSALDQLQRMGS